MEIIIRYLVFCLAAVIFYKVAVLITTKVRGNKNLILKSNDIENDIKAHVYDFFMKHLPNLVEEKENYEGKVKSIRRYYTTIKVDTAKKGNLSFVANYDENQKIVDALQYDAKGQLDKRIINEYDNNCNLLLVKEIMNDGKELITERNTYNDKNQNVESISYYEDGSICSILRSHYDERGNCIAWEIEEPMDGNTETNYYVCTFDKNDREVERVIEYSRTGDKSKELYTYDSKGNVKEMKVVDGNSGEEESRSVYYYNTNNKVSEIVSYQGAEITEKEDYSYDHNNREVERRVYDKLGNLKSKRVNSYDEKGSLCGFQKYENGVLVFCYLDEIEYYD